MFSFLSRLVGGFHGQVHVLKMACISNFFSIYSDASCHLHTLGIMIYEPDVQKFTVTASNKTLFPEVSGVQICNDKWEGRLVAKLPDPVIVIITV